MKKLLFATVILCAGLTGCHPANENSAPRLWLIDCRTRKMYPLSGEKIATDDPLVPCVVATDIPEESPVEDTGSPLPEK